MSSTGKTLLFYLSFGRVFYRVLTRMVLRVVRSTPILGKGAKTTVATCFIVNVCILRASKAHGSEVMHELYYNFAN